MTPEDRSLHQEAPSRAAPGPRQPVRTRVDTGRSLLFGLLALQNNFIDRDALLGAFNTWIADRSRTLGQILLERGALSPSRHMLLEALVAEHVRLHGDDPEQSLAALSSIGSVRDDLSRVADPDVQASLAHVSATRRNEDDPFRTVASSSVGESTSAGTRFRVLRSHARGGVGEVFVARDTELNRDVALKEIQDRFADVPRHRARFEFEAEVTGGLEHPGVVPVYGLGHTPDGRPFYAMRFIKGNSLKEVVRRFHEAEKQPDRNPGQSALELRDLLGRFMDVCDAVAYAHSRGVLHRDLKPGNIMLGKYGETLVVDWGLAKALGHPEPESPIERSELPLKPESGSELEPTEADSAVGTPGYMSPEQVDRRVGPLGVRSDVYCLGATLYHLLTGHAPCEGEQRGEIYQKVLKGDIPRPHALNPRIAPALEAICLKALGLKPADRYESPQALKADLERWLADEPVEAYPEPLPTRAMRWVRRHKPWVAAAAGLFLMALLGLAVHDWQIGREKVRTAEQLGMTRAALRQLLGVAGEKLAVIAQTEPLRQELAQLVLDKYRDLVAKFPDDPSVRLEMAHVLRVIAGIERITGKFAESDRSYDQAIAILTALCAAEPGRLEYRRWLAQAFLERGELHHMYGKIRRAEELFTSAIAQSETLLLQPISTPYRRAKGSALIDLSEILVLENRLPEARRRADQAVELLKPIAQGMQDSSQSSQDRWLLCLALTSRGVASQERDPAAAARDFHEAEAVANQVTDEDDPFYDDLQFQLACLDNHRGELTGQTRSPLEGHESALERAFQRLTKLAEKYTLRPHYREELAVTRSRRAAVRLARRRLAEAQADCQAAIDLLEHLITEQAREGAPENAQYFSLLGQATILAGRIQAQQGHLHQGRILRDKAAQNLRRALQIDEARAQDKETLDQLQAEIDRNISGVEGSPE